MARRNTPNVRSQLLARLRESEDQAAFLVNAGNLLRRTNQLLAAELGVEATLARVARLALPHHGVWSILDVRDGDHTRRVAVSHPVRELQPLAEKLASGWPPARDWPSGEARVFRTGRSEIAATVSDAELSQVADSAEHLALLRSLHIGSTLTVALKDGDTTIGLLTFLSNRGGHAFDERDCRLAEDLAASAALAITTARAAAARRSFMSSLSHGLRTPLHNIYGYAQLLGGGIRGPLTGDQQHDVRRIQANDRHLLNLVNAVIDFARWEDGDPPVLEDVLLRDAIEQAASLLGLALDGRTATVRRRVPRNLVVRADRERLEAILVQLLENAVKFSREKAAIEVHALVVGTRVWIRVKDTGIGIAREDLALIFQPFVRSRDPYARAQAGAGLGLAITRQLARAMDGDLTVVSRYGKGSIFTVALPRGRMRPGPRPSSDAPTRRPRTVTSRPAPGGPVP
jgi:signal transduction histidine kinase